MPNGPLYLRYSSHNQRDVSIDQQRKACEAFAKRQGITVNGIYEDRALTGTNDNRPGFQQMIRDAAKSGWDYIIVYSLDRFARNRYDSAVYKRTLKEYGIKVLSAMENIADDPSGILMESLLEGLAEYYSKELSQKIQRGMNDNATKCMVNGLLPLGYRRSEDGRYAVDPVEAATVLQIFRSVADCVPFSQIIADLNERGIYTKLKRPWTKSSFTKMLSNERYLGIYKYKNVRIPGGIPQIVPTDLFEAVQLRLASKPNARAVPGVPQRRRRENGTYLLTGKLFCGYCKEPMVGVSGTGKSGDLFYYYLCKGRRSHSGCRKEATRRDQVEELIAAELRRTMLTDEAINILADTAISYQANNDTTLLDLAALETQLCDTERAITNLLSAIEAGLFTATTRDRMLALEEDKTRLTNQIAVLRENAGDPLTKEEIVAALKLFQKGDIHDKNYQEALIDTFLVAAYLYDDHLGLIFRITGDGANIPLNPADIALPEGVDVRISDSSLHQITLYEHLLFFAIVPYSKKARG